MEAMTLERAQARANEIEDAICRGKMDVYQVFTQMRQLIPSAHLAQPAQAVDVGKVVGYLVEKKPRVVSDAPARSFYFADQHNPTDPNWWIAGEQKKYTVTPLTRALSGEKAGPVDGCYYLQDSRSYTGNCPMWWAKDGKGYVTRLDEAHRYTFGEAMKQHRMRETDIPWACAYIDALSRPTVDIQHMRQIKDQVALLPASPTPDKEGA